MGYSLSQALAVGLAASQLASSVCASKFGSPLYSNNFGDPGINATYDYIIVGGGTGGLAIASRLAENSSLSVAVIEAGGFYEQDNGNRSVIPGYYSDALGGGSTDWGFVTQKDPALANTSINYYRGKTLGGSSALNAMIYQLGSKGSYDAWADAVGDQSWNFSNLLPFFHKSTNYTNPNNAVRFSNSSVPAPSTLSYGNTTGPLHVSFPKMAMPFSSWGKNGLGAIGIPEISDFTSGLLLGRQWNAFTIRPDDATRSSSEASFLQDAFARNELSPNLKVYVQSLAKKIQFSSNKTATGVLVKTGVASQYLLSARKEIIVSAGAFQSPQLLMVSGVGPTAQLTKHNITTIANRPGVGQNMWDHILWAVGYQVNVSTIATLSQPAFAVAQRLPYLQNQTGFLSNTGADYLGWEKVPQKYLSNMTAEARADLATFPADWPDLEHVVGSNTQPFIISNQSYAALLPALVVPLSRGNVTLASADMADAPIINLGWLTNRTDVEVAIVGIKRAREFWASDAMKGVRIGEELQPGKNVTTDAQIEEWLRSHAETVYHVSCTCKMGKVSDPMAVLDSRARVIGVKGLRVVDASSFPLLVPGHPQSTIYALAEKIAHDILTRGA